VYELTEEDRPSGRNQTSDLVFVQIGVPVVRPEAMNGDSHLC